MNWKKRIVFLVAVFLHTILFFLILVLLTIQINLTLLKVVKFLAVPSINEFILDNLSLVFWCSFFLAGLIILLIMRLIYVTSSRYRRFIDKTLGEPFPFLTKTTHKGEVRIMSEKSLSASEIAFLKRTLFSEQFKWFFYLVCVFLAIYSLLLPRSFSDGCILGLSLAYLVHLKLNSNLISVVKKLIDKEGIKSIELGNAEKKE